MSKHLGLLFDTNKTKCDKEVLTQQLCSFGLNFHVYYNDILFLIDKNVNISFGCSLWFCSSENWQKKGYYLDVMLSDKLSKESLIYIISNLINISKEMGFKIIYEYTYEINEFNFNSFNFEKDETKSAKEYYLGSIDHSKQIQKEPLDVNKLISLEHEDEGTVVNIACSNCHIIVEGKQGAADALCKAANIPLRTDFKGKYFLTNYCLVCQEVKGNYKIELKDISDLIN